ncbi:hypothetical protein GCM10011504_14080 [Siccirubricoccus deserti]|uniref:DUF1178 family protein n=1 Tax=Siccirubricoccus deserti TaxID=2013562 RepID=A0A9X0QWP3_9PROT|nr:DUF1178 family protein [Siccirubricoccus deserti]MBC4014940.1 DUF1178 family protein [Siccirubricoccus deserti]GGC36911.1 hypothetical protein GCM10011504_14080 [Siccirubricoccus deserti]
MIHYDLRCGSGHEFDGWFKDSEAYNKQAKAGFVQCPVCGGTEVTKQLMAPAIPKKGRKRVQEVPPPLAEAPAAPPAATRSQAAAGPVPAQVMALLQRMRSEVEKHCDYVGNEFAEEARKIHRGESDRRGIYGEASDADADALREEGIEVARIPWVPRADG